MKTLIYFCALLLASSAFGGPVSDATLAELKSYGSLRSCYQQWVANTSPIDDKTGLMIITLGIDPTGTVMGVQPDEKNSTIKDKMFTECVIQALLQVNFKKEAGKQGKNITVSLKFPLSK